MRSVLGAVAGPQICCALDNLRAGAYVQIQHLKNNHAANLNLIGN
jgi:hypothetical protein